MDATPIFATNHWIDQCKKQLQCRFVRLLTFTIVFVILINANTRVVAQELMQKGIVNHCQTSIIKCTNFETFSVTHQKSIRFIEDNVALLEFGLRLDVDQLNTQLKASNLNKSDQRQLIQKLTHNLNQSSIRHHAERLTELEKSGAIVSHQPLTISNGLLIHFRPKRKVDIANFFTQSKSISQTTIQSAQHKPHELNTDSADTLILSKNQGISVAVDNDKALNSIGISQEREKDAKSVTIALIDSGVSTHHQELSHLNQLLQYNPKDNSFEVKDTGFGHGTGVLSLMAGSNQHNLRIGALPQANYISCNGLPSGSYNYLWVTSCYDWLLQQPDVDIVVNSWLQPSMTCNDELLYSLRLLWLANSIPIFSAGNFGQEAVTTRDPANFRLFKSIPLITVGATDTEGHHLPESSHASQQCDDSVEVPTVSAPGSHLTVASPFQANSYQQVSGTSFSVAYVATALAVLIYTFPDNTNLEIIQALLAGASQDNGVINLTKSIQILEESTKANIQNQ